MQDRRDVLKMQEVAKTMAWRSPANVNQALSTGFIDDRHGGQRRRQGVQADEAAGQRGRKTVGAAAGAAVESEEAVLSRQRILAAIGMAEAAMARKYGYVDEALGAMDQVLVVLTDEARAAYAACDNALFLEIRNYAIQFAKMMNTLAYRLPGLVMVDFMGGVHPLVAAYAIYNDAKRHRDLEQRNIVDANGRFRPLVVGVAPQMKPVVITVGGGELTTWTEMTLERKKEELTGSLSVIIFAGGMPPVPMFAAQAGAEIQVYIGGQLAFTGTVDRREGKAEKKADHKMDKGTGIKAYRGAKASEPAAPKAMAMKSRSGRTNTPSSCRRAARPSG